MLLNSASQKCTDNKLTSRHTSEGGGQILVSWGKILVSWGQILVSWGKILVSWGSAKNVMGSSGAQTWVRGQPLDWMSPPPNHMCLSILILLLYVHLHIEILLVPRAVAPFAPPSSGPWGWIERNELWFLQKQMAAVHSLDKLYLGSLSGETPLKTTLPQLTNFTGKE